MHSSNFTLGPMSHDLDTYINPFLDFKSYKSVMIDWRAIVLVTVHAENKDCPTNDHNTLFRESLRGSYLVMDINNCMIITLFETKAVIMLQRIAIHQNVSKPYISKAIMMALFNTNTRSTCEKPSITKFSFLNSGPSSVLDTTTNVYTGERLATRDCYNAIPRMAVFTGY